jgi:hypothetical protein
LDPQPFSILEKKLPSEGLPPATQPCPTQAVWYSAASATLTIAANEKAHSSASSNRPPRSLEGEAAIETLQSRGLTEALGRPVILL